MNRFTFLHVGKRERVQEGKLIDFIVAQKHSGMGSHLEDPTQPNQMKKTAFLLHGPYFESMSTFHEVSVKSGHIVLPAQEGGDCMSGHFLTSAGGM